MGLELSVLNDQVLIGGELLRTQDWFDLQSGLQSYVDHWQWRARVNPIIETEFIEQLSKEKLGSLGPGWQIELRPEVTLLSPIPLNAKSPLLMRARRLGFLLTPSIQTSIKVLVTMAEVKKS